MTTKKADEKVEDKAEDGNDDPKDDDKGSGGDGSAAGSLEQHVRDLVEKAVSSLLGDRSEGSGKRGDDEDELYRRVKSAQDKIKADEEKEGRLKKVEETVAKITEKPPTKDTIGTKLSRFMWGGDDK